MNTNSHTPVEPKVGTVYLVGAGPGDASLITRRGYDLLMNHADVVLVDALVDPSLLSELPDRVERRYVGKRAGQHVMPQHDIEALMVELAKSGKNVVRLKGGDPLIFGRGGEEAVTLREAGVPFEIVPGITAAIAATTYAGIPLTYRRKACYAVLFTANAAPARDDEHGVIPLHEFAKLKDGTLVAYMGVRVLAKVAEALIEDGMPADQPAAMIERGATGAQKVVRAPLSELATKAKEANIRPPALIVIGPTTALAEQIAWYEPGPLAQKRVVVTRPAGQSQELVDGLRELGADVLHIPAIRFEERFNRNAWESLLESVDVHRSQHHGASKWLVFTSENGVRYFFDGLKKMGRDLRWTGSFKIAAVGVATGNELEKRGLNPDLIPQTSTGKALGEELAGLIEQDTNDGSTENSLVIRVRGELANPAVEAALENAGVTVHPITVYATVDAPIDELDRAWMHQKDPDILTFTSGSTFQAFRRQWGEEEADRLLKACTICSIGPVTSSLIRGMGFDVAHEADPHNNEGILKVLAEMEPVA
jgi:uroporphyrinogen III methyltransferase / synthase